MAIKITFDEDGKIIDKEKISKQIVSGLKKDTESIPDNKRNMADMLIASIAYYYMEIAELQKETLMYGHTERYQNGANQYGIKESIASKKVETFQKCLNDTVTKLSAMMPEKKELNVKLQEDLEDFVRGRED